MTIRGRRYLLVLGVLLLLVLGVLAAFEWDRRRQVALAGPEKLEGSGIALSAQDFNEKYRDTEEFAKLCADLQDRYEALRKRLFTSRHTRKSRWIEYDRKGETVARMEITDHVYFVGEEERKTEIERRQLLGKPFPFDPDRLKAEHPNEKAKPPFAKDLPAGFYRYQLAGVEKIQERPLLRVKFEPTEPVERSFKGWTWVDPTTHEPVRMQASLAKTRWIVDRFEMLVDYGLSENGCNQVRHTTIDVQWGGGFAFISRHYRIETAMSDYRSLEHASGPE
jgi:hypothetical protein